MFDHCLMSRSSRDESSGDSDSDATERSRKHRRKDTSKKVCVSAHCFEILRAVYMESGILFLVSSASSMQ